MLRKTNPTLPMRVTLRDNVGYENKMCQEVLPLLNAECFVIRAHLWKSNPVKVEHSSRKLLPYSIHTTDRSSIPTANPRLSVNLIDHDSFLAGDSCCDQTTGLQPKTQLSTISLDFRPYSNGYRQSLAKQASF